MRLLTAPAALLSLIFSACASGPPESSLSPRSLEVLRSSAEQAPAPAPGGISRTTVQESATSATQILRLAPGGEIAEHHHPFFDEVLVLERGVLRAVLNGTAHELQAGDVVFIPAGTVIGGRNHGTVEARAVAVFSNIGRSGPLTVPGSPHH